MNNIDNFVWLPVWSCPQRIVGAHHRVASSWALPSSLRPAADTDQPPFYLTFDFKLFGLETRCNRGDRNTRQKRNSSSLYRKKKGNKVKAKASPRAHLKSSGCGTRRKCEGHQLCTCEWDCRRTRASTCRPLHSCESRQHQKISQRETL